MLDQGYFPLYGVEIAGLQVQQVVIVADAAQAAKPKPTVSDKPGRQRPMPRAGEQSRQPGVGRCMRWQRQRVQGPVVSVRTRASHASARCGLRRSKSMSRAGSTVKQANAQSSTPQPAIQPSSATAWKSANMAAKNARASVAGRRQVADGDVRGRVQESRAHVRALPPGLFVAHHPQDAIIAHADEHDRERRRQNVQMAHRQRQPAHRPGRADQQRRHRQQRIPDAAIDQEKQQRDAGDGQPRRQLRIVVGRRHLVGFQHRQAGQAKLDARDNPAVSRHDGADGVDALESGGEGTLLP